MSRLSVRLRSLREEKGLSQNEMAKFIGKSKSSVNMYERGEREPGIEILEAYADYFNVDMEYLIGKTDVRNRFSDNSIPAAENIIPMPKMRKIPLVGTIACGTPILAVENVESNVDVPEHIHADFALRCKGDSMIGVDIRDGDIVYIRQQDEVDPGQIAALLVEDEATLKRFYYDPSAGIVTLVSENPALPPQVYQGETLNHIKILGLAVGLTRCFK